QSSTNWKEGLSAPAIGGFLQEVLPVNEDKLMIYTNYLNS
ncbi:MAG: hypothetical protein JWQ28_588, partial [Pedobacter sp.]|nr:hypothetical protein [Pedobacter sp.]